MSSASCLIFDLDGTLSDPAVGIGRCLNYALAAFGYPPLPDRDVSQYIGPPLDLTFAALTGSRSIDHTAALVAKYRERYAEVGYADGVAPRRSTMIGDRAVDIRAAAANGLPSVGVPWDHGSEEELVAAGPDRLLRSVEELAQFRNAG